MINLSAPTLTVVATLFAVLVCFYATFRVCILRAQHGVKAPGITRRAIFGRAYPVQLNTLERRAYACLASLLVVATIGLGDTSIEDRAL